MYNVWMCSGVCIYTFHKHGLVSDLPPVAERKSSLGKEWHPTCLRCENCDRLLSPGRHSEVHICSRVVQLQTQCGYIHVHTLYIVIMHVHVHVHIVYSCAFIHVYTV